MTEPLHKASITEENSLLIVNFESMFIRQVQGAYDQHKMDEVMYRHFKNIRCIAETREGILDHFVSLFRQLIDYHSERNSTRNQLLARIIKGAELIESTPKEHPKYSYYVRVYDALCQELREIEEKG
ncbi:hypothetical protein [Paenibacillus polymyxa]|uniref:hypothetical protein n=1 Tax=Paenibacillus polymyxa TaxID=1406 RepID=UPI000845FCB9|nr:hypothetical protein [Paenibacillus polymyxa]AOK91982.1 hypothetical protein AOU00_20465 [Paenibacillus polymyxa]